MNEILSLRDFVLGSFGFSACFCIGLGSLIRQDFVRVDESFYVVSNFGEVGITVNF